MNRSYQIKREVLAEKEEQERAMRAHIRAFRSQVKDLAKTISATLAADPMWSVLPNSSGRGAKRKGVQSSTSRPSCSIAALA